MFAILPAIIGLLLKPVKTRVVSHKTKALFVGFCCTHITNTHMRDLKILVVRFKDFFSHSRDGMLQ